MKPIVYGRENYAKLLRKNKQREIITQKRLKFNNEPNTPSLDILEECNKGLANPSLPLVTLIKTLIGRANRDY